MWDINQIITLKYRQCDELSISRWSDMNAIFLAVPARKIATSNHLEIDSSSITGFCGDYLITIFSVLVAAHNFQQINEVWWENIMCSYKQTNKLLLILQSTSKYWTLIVLHIVSWEPEGHYHYSKMFHWKPEGHYCCTKSMSDSALLVLNRTSVNQW